MISVRCVKCRKRLPVDCFYIRKDGFYSYRCKGCCVLDSDLKKDIDYIKKTFKKNSVTEVIKFVKDIKDSIDEV